MIPLGGIGSRFQKEGYAAPKPFVRILGREMILWILDSLNPMVGDELVIVYNPNFMDCMEELMRTIVLRELKKILANKIFGYLARCEEKFCI